MYNSNNNNKQVKKVNFYARLQMFLILFIETRFYNVFFLTFITFVVSREGPVRRHEF